MTRIARFANTHPCIVLMALLMLAAGMVGLAVFGAVSLFIEPVLPKLFLFAAVALAAFVAMKR